MRGCVVGSGMTGAGRNILGLGGGPLCRLSGILAGDLTLRSHENHGADHQEIADLKRHGTDYEADEDGTDRSRIERRPRSPGYDDENQTDDEIGQRHRGQPTRPPALRWTRSIRIPSQRGDTAIVTESNGHNPDRSPKPSVKIMSIGSGSKNAFSPAVSQMLNVAAQHRGILAKLRLSSHFGYPLNTYDGYVSDLLKFHGVEICRKYFVNIAPMLEFCAIGYKCARMNLFRTSSPFWVVRKFCARITHRDIILIRRNSLCCNAA